MTGSDSRETTKIVSFHGDDLKWREWLVKAKAVGAKKGWLKMIEKAGDQQHQGGCGDPQANPT